MVFNYLGCRTHLSFNGTQDRAGTTDKSMLHFTQPWLWAPSCGELDYYLSGHVLEDTFTLHKYYCLNFWHIQWVSNSSSLTKITLLLISFLENHFYAAYLLDLSGFIFHLIWISSFSCSFFIGIWPLLKSVIREAIQLKSQSMDETYDRIFSKHGILLNSGVRVECKKTFHTARNL